VDAKVGLAAFLQGGPFSSRKPRGITPRSAGQSAASLLSRGQLTWLLQPIVRLGQA
jgi:hypothetical protein